MGAVAVGRAAGPRGGALAVGRSRQPSRRGCTAGPHGGVATEAVAAGPRSSSPRGGPTTAAISGAHHSGHLGGVATAALAAGLRGRPRGGVAMGAVAAGSRGRPSRQPSHGSVAAASHGGHRGGAAWQALAAGPRGSRPSRWGRHSGPRGGVARHATAAGPSRRRRAAGHRGGALAALSQRREAEACPTVGRAGRTAGRGAAAAALPRRLAASYSLLCVNPPVLRLRAVQHGAPTPPQPRPMPLRAPPNARSYRPSTEARADVRISRDSRAPVQSIRRRKGRHDRFRPRLEVTLRRCLPHPRVSPLRGPSWPAWSAHHSIGHTLGRSRLPATSWPRNCRTPPLYLYSNTGSSRRRLRCSTSASSSAEARPGSRACDHSGRRTTGDGPERIGDPNYTYTPRAASHGRGSIFFVPFSQTSKCRWGPVAWPRSPISAIC